MAVPENDPLQAKTGFVRRVEYMAQWRPITWFLVHVGRHIDPVLMRISNGRVNVTGTHTVLILHHRGARTGKKRQTPLVYFTQGNDVILVASRGGSSRNPAWFHNILANPEVELRVGRQGGAYHARPATPKERAALWPLACTLYNGYASYQDLAGEREIPLVICSPSVTAAG